MNISITNAVWLDDTWHLVDRTQANHFKVLKWTPFKFSFYNKLYNYYRLTDDGALVLWISPDNNNLDEWLYMKDKNNSYIEAKVWQTTNITFLVDKTKITMPVWLNYININWQYKVSDGNPTDVRKGNVIEITDWEILRSNNWLYGLEPEDMTAIENMSDAVLYNDTWTNSYIMITPWFINLDMSDKTKNHWVYEKAFYDTKWNLFGMGYMWNGYVEWTTQEVRYGIVLYNSTYYNNIRLFYWDIDTTITDKVFVWITNWNSMDKINVAYSNLELWSLDLKDDIVIDWSKVFQELIFPLGYEPDALDSNDDLILEYEERDTVAPYIFFDKPKSKFALKFSVKINTDKVVCQREYVTSAWWDTLRWWKKDSARADFDDIDTFCFSAETPWIVILDNASYAKGWYRVWQSQCVVNHLSLMWFNASSIGWNTNPANNCWLTYKIQDIAKDLSIEKTSPYAILNKFEDDVDIRPVDTTETINTKSIVFTSPKWIIVSTDTWDIEMSILDPHFIPNKIKMITSDLVYLYWDNWTDSYLLYSTNRWDKWKIIKKIDSKIITYSIFMDNIILLFFEDGTYIRNIEGWLGWWSQKVLQEYEVINDIWFISNKRWILIWNEWKMWITANSWDSFELFDIKTKNNLQTWEHLQSIDIYWSNDVWISTNKWNILYSPNAWEAYFKRTTGSSMEFELNTFEDGINVFESNFNTWIIWNYTSYIDKPENKTLKFSNDLQYTPWCVVWNNQWQLSNTDIQNSTNLEPFTVNEYDKIYPKWDLYIEYFIDTKDEVKELNTMKLSDPYGNSIEINVKKIFDDNWEKQKIGWNKLKVSITDILSDNYIITAPADTTSSIEHFQRLENYELSDIIGTLETGERIGIWKISFAPASNLTNVIVVNRFNANLTNTSTRTCKTTTNTELIKMVDWSFNLNSFVNTDGQLKWFLTIDIFVEDKNKWGIKSIELGNEDNKKITWNNLANFSSLWIWIINNWWNTFVLPFNKDNSSDIYYSNQWDINWQYLTYFKINSLSSNETSYNRYAIDNIRYSSVAQTNLKNIRFFNQKEWIAFDDNSSYITNNNTSWWALGSFSRWAWTNMLFTQFIKIRWREIYAIWNDSGWWFTYYSLDKWRNFKMYFSDSWVKLNSFDLIDYDDWLAVSETWIIYEFTLESD